MKITWFGHSCFRVETGKSVVLMDPFLKGNATFEKSGVAWDAATQGVTHVALTHGHDDHLGDSVEICKMRGATLFAVYELAMHLSGQGVEKVEPMNTGGTVRGARISTSPSCRRCTRPPRAGSTSATLAESFWRPREDGPSTIWATRRSSATWR